MGRLLRGGERWKCRAVGTVSGYYEEPPTANESFLGLQYLLPESAEWQLPKYAAKEVYRRINDRQSRNKLMSALCNGLIRSYAEHAFVEWTLDDDKIFKNWAEFSRWVRTNRQYGNGGGEQVFHCPMRVPTSFWEFKHSENCAWQGWFGPFTASTMAEWQTGEFGSAYSRISGDYSDSEEPPSSEAVGYAIYYNVRFQSADVEAVFGPEQDEGVSTRRSKYDWEAAIAAFCAAQWKHDVVADVHAHGAQATVEGWLTSWLGGQGKEPSEQSVRTRARLILKEMLRADKH